MQGTGLEFCRSCGGAGLTVSHDVLLPRRVNRRLARTRLFAPPVQQAGSEGTRRGEDRLVYTQEPGQIQVIYSIPAIGEVFAESRILPAAAAAGVRDPCVGDDVGMLEIILGID